jgi:PAS domain S-box-containing protein
MPGEQILVLTSQADIIQQLERAGLVPAGYEVIPVADLNAAETKLRAFTGDLLIQCDPFTNSEGLKWVAGLVERHPDLPVILLVKSEMTFQPISMLRLGLADCLVQPVRTGELLPAVHRALERRKRLQSWRQSVATHADFFFDKRLKELETLGKIGRSITASLELDTVLKMVVDAAVELTGAEEGSLLMLDESTGELYMRAARNFQEDFVRTLRLPISDTLAGQVLSSGAPFLLDQDSPEKIKTSYLVHTLIYVPMQVRGRMIGVLGVDNRQKQRPLTNDHVALVAALADFAAIAIENAQLYERSEIERNKLETILKKLEEGVIIVDFEGRLLLINQTACKAFGLTDERRIGKPIGEVIQNPDLLEFFAERAVQTPFQSEITAENGRIFNAQLTPVPEVGLALTMQDITHLKELDHIKSEFVNTVSHDLRSPLTAILGYIELIERVGPVTTQQMDFIRRVQVSVQNITALINDLLDLGRIEAGFDTRKEAVSLLLIVRFALDGFENRLSEKQLNLMLDLPKDLPPVFGNPVRLRQLVANLVGNAVKYTQPGGTVTIHMHAEGEQVILQVVDDGPGIPAIDQPYIFDKFYRGSNVPTNIPGTGLGLAIVKSIVDNHQGRIWVDSVSGKGSSFTVVLPTVVHSPQQAF